MKSPILTLLTCLVLASCGGDARTLARSTGTAVGTVSEQIDGFATTKQRLATVRTARLADYAGSLAATQKEIEIEKELLRISGKKKPLKLFDEIGSFAKRLAEVETLADVEAEKLRKVLVDERSDLTTQAEQLKSVKSQLDVLGKDESLGDRVEFLIVFGKAVKAAMDEAKKDKDDAVDAAKKGIEESN